MLTTRLGLSPRDCSIRARISSDLRNTTTFRFTLLECAVSTFEGGGGGLVPEMGGFDAGAEPSDEGW